MTSDADFIPLSPLPLQMPHVVHGGTTPAPTDSETLTSGANALGFLDLIGNVWQYTDSEYADGQYHQRASNPPRCRGHVVETPRPPVHSVAT